MLSRIDAMAKSGAKLIFVYNADGGMFNTLTDTVHKVFSPSTYACSLCFITHGVTGMFKEWKEFLGTLGIPMEFLHRSEFRAAHPEIDAELPLILLDAGQGARVLLSAPEINRAGSLDALTKQLKDALAANGL